MMKKRIAILSLALVFLISTTGLPVTYHLCAMMGEKALEECEVCMIEMEKIETSCCEPEEVEKQIQVTSQNPVCCQDEFVFNKVEDDFIYSKSETTFFLSFENIFQDVTLLPPSIDFQKEESFYCDSSPPFLINPEIHITNSAFLI